jgi:hypothetical protein
VWFCVTCKAVLFSTKLLNFTPYSAMTYYHCPSRAILGVVQWKGYLGKEQREEECVKIAYRVFVGHSTNSVEHTRFWEANSSSASHQIPRLVGNTVYKFPPLVPIQRQIWSSPQFPLLCKAHFDVICPSVPRSSSWPLSFGFPHQNHLCISLRPCAYHIAFSSSSL